MRNQLSALEIYMNRVFKAFIVGLPFAACLAGITFTILKVLGYYPSVSLIALIIFDVTNVIYIILGIIVRVKCEDNNRLLKPRIVFIGKILIIVVEVIQWNFIAYMIPSVDTWAFSFFFVILTSFLLDSKFTLICALVIVGSTFISWQINGANYFHQQLTLIIFQTWF